VGRPDLAAKSDFSSKDLAGMLYDSLQKLKAFPDDIRVYPGHGAGSALGKNIASGLFTTLGAQKHSNYGLT
jgi:glyoxylase-like metal-dependent hydrolase (beta-lactamase superfamily II)